MNLAMIKLAENSSETIKLAFRYGASKEKTLRVFMVDLLYCRKDWRSTRYLRRKST